MTPYELSLSVEVYQEKHEQKLQEDLTLVWLGEYYHRIKKLPNLQEELKKVSSNSQKRVMTNEEMLAKVKILNAQFGGTFKKGGE